MQSRIITLSVLAVLCAFTVADVQAHPATGIVVDRGGQVYFSDLETVWKIDARGRLSVFRPGVNGRHVHELTLDEDGNLYGGDYSYEPATARYPQAVWKMTPGGSLTYLFAPTVNLPKGASIWRDRQGNTYFFEQNNHLKQETLLLKRTPDGHVTTLAGGSYGHADGKGGSVKFSSVGGLAWGAGGSLYVTDGAAVRRISTDDGTVTTLANNLDAANPEDYQPGEKPYGGLMGIAVDSRGDAYVADHAHRRLLKITADGKVYTTLRAEPPWSPTGAAIAEGGDIYVMEIGFIPPRRYTGPRVRKITPDGRSILIATVGEASHDGIETNTSHESGAASRRADEEIKPAQEETTAARKRHEASSNADDNHQTTNSRTTYSIAFTGFAILSLGAFAWLRFRN